MIAFTIIIVIGIVVLICCIISSRRENAAIRDLINNELENRHLQCTNTVWLNSMYYASDLQKDKIINIKYNKSAGTIIDVNTIDFHTTAFLTNGIKTNDTIGDYMWVDEMKKWLVYIDDTARRIMVIDPDKYKDYKKFEFADILSVELVKDSEVITTHTHSTTNTIGRAVVGAAIAGGVGAIIGGNTSKSKSTSQEVVSRFQVVVTIKNIQHPTLILSDIIKEDVARLVMNAFAVIIDTTQTPQNITNSMSEELLRLHQLKEQKILTEDEFLVLKDKILS